MSSTWRGGVRAGACAERNDEGGYSNAMVQQCRMK
jgi:hypothetical protein